MLAVSLSKPTLTKLSEPIIFSSISRIRKSKNLKKCLNFNQLPMFH